MLSLSLLLGLANAPILVALWALHLSVIHIGQVWWGYGWENQLAETGFLAIFLAPWLDPRPWPKRPPPAPVLWLFRWLAFRIFLGAGLIKLRGDPCWRELTCLDFHFLTQPIPNPLSPLFHFAPPLIHRLEVLFNHAVELVCPFFVFGPRRLRHIAGGMMVLFQLVLILSGNLSFLNWLTIVPLLACFDDQLLERLSPSSVRAAVAARSPVLPALRSHAVAGWALLLLVGALSIAPVENLLSSEQRMNTAHEPFELVNSYGAFGSVGRKVRREIIFEGADELGPAAVWRPYEFKCKPGDPDRRPCWISPYHHRLDWQIWFAAMEDVLRRAVDGPLRRPVAAGRWPDAGVVGEQPVSESPTAATSVRSCTNTNTRRSGPLLGGRESASTNGCLLSRLTTTDCRSSFRHSIGDKCRRTRGARWQRLALKPDGPMAGRADAFGAPFSRLTRAGDARGSLDARAEP